ncbi:MAG: GNAT family N-acetyltransferase [Nocardioidaceae bacterium]|nr:GNAT family N-acetyltransferase [Nocardioidaceae bacterium]
MGTPYPLRTERLVIRLMSSDDAAAFAAYRNDPEVARFQAWDLPYTEDDARALIADQADRDDLVAGSWTQLAVEHQGRVVGDVCAGLDEHAGVAEIGFTLAPEHQGHGYATEAALALVTDLVERLGVVRVRADLDPANVASMRVLEAIGLDFEVTTRQSYRWRGSWADNTAYGATAAEWRAWQARPLTSPTDVRLVPLDADNVSSYAALRTHHSQEAFVAPMHQSFRDALFPDIIDGLPAVPRLFGVAADGEPVGFVMYADTTPTCPEPYLWRFLVDRRHQRRRIGWRALDLLCDLLRGQGHRTLTISWQEGPGGPEPFYRRYGFERTGREIDGEIEGRLHL